MLYKEMNMPLKEKQVNVRLTESQHAEIEEKAKKANFSTTSEYLRYAATNCWPELCRSFLFCIEAPNYDANILTAYIKDVKIDYDSVSITFLLDETNIWKKFIESKTDFKIWWLTRTGDKVDYFKVEHYRYSSMRVFPLHFGHEVVDVPLGMAVFKS